MPDAGPAIHTLSPPYRELRPVTFADPRRDPLGADRGSAVVWRMSLPLDEQEVEAVQGRSGGVPLVVVLPPAESLDEPDSLLEVVERCRPQSVLPHHERLDPGEIRSVLSRPPEDFPIEVGEYLTWRGIILDTDTRRIVRRIAELSADLRTVSALARSLYLSRRALGRRFMQRGLPVPSHWLQAFRLLRAAIELQTREDNVFIVAVSLGYPDGFSLSNQMKRLIGVRPTDVRTHLGWEWILEAWLAKEAQEGGMAPEWARLFRREGGESEENGDTALRRMRSSSRRVRASVAE